jgi:dienelactone hydrolase
MKIVFLHGLEGSPHGTKPTWLREAGHDVSAPELDTTLVRAHLEQWMKAGQPAASSMPASAFRAPLQTAREALQQAGVDVVVGSSFGGGLALECARLGLWRGPLVLLAPAGRKLFGITSVEVSRLAILHGRGDDVVPLADSLALAEQARAEGTLRVVDDDHRLTASVAAGLLGELLQIVGAQRP